MRYCKFICILIFTFIFLLLSGCMSYNEDGIYYYETLQDALADINDGRIGKRDQDDDSDAGAMIDLQEGVPTLCLLKNTTTGSTVRLNGANLNLNGFVLTNNETALIATYGICRIYNGSLHRLCDNNNGFGGVVISKGSTCYIENIILQTESSSRTNVAVHIYGEMFLSASTIEAITLASDQNSLTAAVYGSICSNIYVEDADIIAKADFGRVEGVYIGDTGWLVDSNIVAYSNYQSNEVEFTSRSVGCNNYGMLTINNCTVYGVHSGIDSSGTLSVNAGTYCGYGHGGIYCAGVNQTYRVANAAILQAEMPAGYEDMGVGCMQGGLYIGGGKNKDNIIVFIDNCIIKADKNPIVLRGTSGEKNNSLYISNTTIDVKHIRVDNNTHRVYLGEGCNFGVSDIDNPEVAVCTGVSYAGHQCG